MSHLLVTHLSVQVWRCLWNMMDAFFFTFLNVALLESYLISIGSGYTFCLLLFALQYPFYLCARRLRQTHRFAEHVFEVFIKVLATGASVLLWRGTWGLCRDFLLKKLWHFWITHAMAVLVLVTIQVFSTIGHPVISVDCEHGWGAGQIYTIDYFRNLYLHWRHSSILKEVSVKYRSLIDTC